MDEGLKKRASSKGVSRKFNQIWGGKYSRRVFLFIERWQFFLFSHQSNPPQKRQKDEIENEPDDFKT